MGTLDGRSLVNDLGLRARVKWLRVEELKHGEGLTSWNSVEVVRIVAWGLGCRAHIGITRRMVEGALLSNRFRAKRDHLGTF